MANIKHDQAEGLRRLMAKPRPRVVSLLSACANTDQQNTMTNLAATLASFGYKVLLLNASHGDMQASLKPYGVGAVPTLLSVTQGKHRLIEAIVTSELGFSFAHLMSTKGLTEPMQNHTANSLNELLEGLAQRFDLILVNAVLAGNTLPLPVLNQGEIIIQLNHDADSVKEAYKLIKKQYSELGKRSFGVLVSGVSHQKAEEVYKGLAKVARQYLALELEFVGAIPMDEHLKRASHLGRAIVDAFPKAAASKAFKSLAERFATLHGAAMAQALPAQQAEQASHTSTIL